MQTSTSALASSERKEADRTRDVHCTMGGPNGVIMDLVRSFSARQTAFISPKTKSFFRSCVFKVHHFTARCSPRASKSCASLSFLWWKRFVRESVELKWKFMLMITISNQFYLSMALCWLRALCSAGSSTNSLWIKCDAGITQQLNTDTHNTCSTWESMH